MNILNNRWIQFVLVCIVLFGLLMITGITINMQLGAAGWHFNVSI